MLDNDIVELYFARNEEAISETERRFSRELHSISFHILNNHEDANECVNDTYVQAWQSMPPTRPTNLAAYLMKITRNLSISRLRNRLSKKRGGDVRFVPLDELSECVPGGTRAEDRWETVELCNRLNRFLLELPCEKRIIFLRRYWFGDSVKEIARQRGVEEKAITNTLFVLRTKLKAFLEG